MSLVAYHFRLLLMGLACVLLLAPTATAHPGHVTSGTATVHPNGLVDISVSFDVPSYLLNDSPSRVTPPQMYGLLDGAEEVLQKKTLAARHRFAGALRVVVNGQPQAGKVTRFPDTATILKAAKVPEGTRLPLVLEGEITTQLPPGTTEVQFQASELLGTVILTVEREGYEPLAIPLKSGADSSVIAVTMTSARLEGATGPSLWRIMSQYVLLGFEHIVPEGLDHILFVLGLFLLSPKIKPLLMQVTCFTVAHSLTLGLAMFGLVRAPAAVVEPVIALSIAFVAVENLWTNRLSPWRPAVVFVFGLVHGLGFASVLNGLGLPRSDFVPAVVSFNIGVELGQLAVIAAAFLVVGWARNLTWYRMAIVRPASVAIAGVGLFWTVQRVIG